jgi:Flp pilus assembly pilin Flp
MKVLQRLWSDERGQSTTEYILILSVVVMIALKFKSVFSSKIEKLVGDVTNKIDSGVNDQ